MEEEGIEPTKENMKEWAKVCKIEFETFAKMMCHNKYILHLLIKYEVNHNKFSEYRHNKRRNFNDIALKLYYTYLSE